MKKKNWLWYFKESFGASDQFCDEMDLQLKPQFETLFKKKLNWEKIMLFYAPNYCSYDLQKHEVDGLRIYLIDAYLNFNSVEMECVIYWFSLQKDKVVGYEEKNCKGKLRFVLESVSSMDKYSDLLPGSEEKVPIVKMEIDTYFPVLIYGGKISMDGYFYVKLIDDKEITLVEKCLDEAIDQWNEDEGEVGGHAIKERGLFHDLYLTEEKDRGYFVFAYDSGYAAEEVFSYLLKTLSAKARSVMEFTIVNEGVIF